MDCMYEDILGIFALQIFILKIIFYYYKQKYEGICLDDCHGIWQQNQASRLGLT